MLLTLLTKETGILQPIAFIMGEILNGIYEFLSLFGIHNIAICIVAFTIVTRMLMLPLTIKQQKTGKLTSRMSPELTAISEKYKGKKDEASQRKMQAETQEVYQRYGTTPFGGCLPMLITLPIMFALYRVIYKVPAYVDDLYLLYEQLTNIIMNIVRSVDAQGIIGGALENFANGFSVSSAIKEVKELRDLGVGVFGSEDYVKAFIDVITQFNSANWDAFMGGTLLETDSWKALLTATSQTADTWIGYLTTTIGPDYMQKLGSMTNISELSGLLNLPSLADTVVLEDLGKCIYWNTFSLGSDFKNVFSIQAVNFNGELTVATDFVQEVLRNNRFIGSMNILDTSGWKFPGILIPIIAAGTQLLQSKMMKTDNGKQNNKSKAEENPVAQSMKGMTTIMPIMSGVICVMLPIGVGIYWIAGTVVQIIQQFFINRYLDKVDIEVMIAKSVEKANKRKAKMGIKTDGGDGKVTSVARTTTKAVENKKADTRPAYNKPREVTDYKRPEGAAGTGGIADLANIMRNRDGDKPSKKKQNGENNNSSEEES